MVIYQGQYYKEKRYAGLYLTLANLPAAMGPNWHLLGASVRAASRQTVLAIAFNMIWKLEESQFGLPGDFNAKRISNFEVAAATLSSEIWQSGCKGGETTVLRVRIDNL